MRAPHPPLRTLLRLLCAGLVVLGLSGLRLAANEEYLVRSWDAETGLPMRGLNCLCLGREGFLWLGGKDGLVRFDGAQFTRETFPDSDLLVGNSVTALWESEQGVLWVGCESGEVFSWDRRQSRVASVPQKWLPQPVRSIAADGYGDVWIALAGHDLVRVRDGWTLHAPPSAPSAGTVQHLLLTTEGRLYQQFGTVLRLQKGTRERPEWTEASLAGTVIQRIAPSRAGGLWIYANDEMRFWTGTEWKESRGPMPPGTFINRMIEASSGDLFIGTLNQGLWIYRADHVLQQLSDSVSVGERVVDIAEDRNGNVLICSDRRLSRIRASRVRVATSPDNWGGSPPVSVTAAPDGTWWMGTEGTGLYHLRGPGRVDHFDQSAGLGNVYVWSLQPDGDDRLWVGTWGGGLYLGRGGRFAPAPGWDSAKGWAVSALYRDAAGAIWAGTNTGLWRYRGGAWSAVTNADGTPVLLVRGMAEDLEGRVWLATNGHGLQVWERGSVRTLGQAEGIPARFISSLHCDRTGDLWVGTLGLGLYRRHAGRWARLDHLQGLPSDDIFHIAEDPQGKFWFTSPVGVFAVAGRELAECAGGRLAAVRPLIIDRDDGLPSGYCSSGTPSAGAMGAGGDFLVPTPLGVAFVPTGLITPRTDRVTVYITSATVDDRPATVAADHTVRAPPGTRRLAIEFTAPSFTNPERIHFRYQLQGLDTHWVDLGARRSVLFSHLPPGDYVLRIMASNPDGVWNPVPASLALTLEPYFWETEWFRATGLLLLAALVGFAVWFVVHRRIQRRIEHLEAQQAIEHERRRIARDIHDELGASLTQIMMMSQAAGPGADGAEIGAALLPRIHAVACDITKSMDELVWAVNPSHDTLESFAAYSARVTQEMVASAGLRFRLNLPEQFPDIRLSAGMRHHLLLVLKEALNNALRHAQAREITVALAVEDSRLLLEVSDDGQGLAPKLRPEPAGAPSRAGGGHGLSNLRRRAEEMGGTLGLVSVPGQGTILRLMVPLRQVSL